MAKIFHKDAWSGGSYELMLELGPHPYPRNARVLEALWSYPKLEGCYAVRDIEPDQQTQIPYQECGDECYGVATLAPSQRVACRASILEDLEGSDWLDLTIDLGALGSVYPVGGFPFADMENARSWQEPFDKWLAAIGHYIYSLVPFSYGFVGFELDYGLNGSPRNAAEIRKQGIPLDRYAGYLFPVDGQLEWYPANYALI